MAMSRSFGSSWLTTRSPMRISPLVIASSPATMRSSVDLPQPEGPTMTTNSPSAMSADTPLMISKSPKLFLTLRSSSFAMLDYFSVSTSPLTNQRCITSTTSAGGASASMDVPMTRFQATAASPPGIMRLMPITTVYMSSCVVTSSGHRYWFQPYMNRITNSAAILVFDSGSTTS